MTKQSNRQKKNILQQNSRRRTIAKDAKKPETGITFGKPEDITQIVSLGYKSFSENKLEGYGMSPSFRKTMLQVTDFIMNEGVFVKRNVKNPKLLDGVILIEESSSWWSEEKILNIALFYVLPEKRSLKTAFNLLKTAKEYAIIEDKVLFIGLSGDIDSESKKKLFLKAGFKELGTNFVFKPHKVHLDKVIQEKESSNG